MADTKISALAAASTVLDDADSLPIVQSGTTKKVTIADLGGQGAGTGQFGTTLFFKDTLRASVEAASGGQATVMYDDQDLPSIMCRVPAFNLEDIDADLGSGLHPAFLVNGTKKSEIWIARFQADVQNVGNPRAVSWPGLDPHTEIDFDDARAACENKGTGWHLMTNWEWAAVAWWVLKQVEDGVLPNQPRGNTDYGRSHDEYQETGTRQDGGTYKPGEATGPGRILTGSGPATWRHNLTFQGISDLVGNVWEWVDGLKIDDGRIYMPSDNYYTLAEASWPATDVYFENDAGTLRLSDTAGSVDASIDVDWNALTMDAGYDSLAEATRKLMVAALIAPRLTNSGSAPLTEEADGRLYVNTDDERMPRRGGYWYSGSSAGLGALHLYHLRSYSRNSIGFRPGYIG